MALLLGAGSWDSSAAFTPAIHRSRGAGGLSTVVSRPYPTTETSLSSFVQKLSNNQSARRPSSSSSLKMSSQDFDQSKYTDAAWANISALTKVADYYQSGTVEAPYLLDTLLNPTKHNAGDDAEAAKRVVEKILGAAGVNVQLLRQELENWFGRQAKLSGSGATQKQMGRVLSQVLDTARQNMGVLGDSFVSTEGMLLALAKEDSQFTRDALRKQDIKYTDLLAEVKKMREKSGPVISRSAENMYDALMKFGIDFTEQAEEGKLDPVIGK